MLDGTDGRDPPRAALVSLLLLLLHSSVASHFHVHLQERMPLLPPFANPPPPPLLGHLGPLLGNLPNTQLSTPVNRGGYPQGNHHQDHHQDHHQNHHQNHHQDHRQDEQIPDTVGTQRLSPLGYPGPQSLPLPPPPPTGGIRDYSPNQLSHVPPHYPSGRPPYLTTFLSYQRPIDAMVDITNELGIVVMQDYAYSRGNFAFSPYGVASILVVLFEAARGDSARQVHAALKLPFDREVVRIGFRDIHRSLRGYFNHEGFLSGVTMSQTKTALLPEFRQVLRFYGYDVDLAPDGFEDNPMEAPSPKPTVTLTDALAAGNLSSTPPNLQQSSSSTTKPTTSVLPSPSTSMTTTTTAQPTTTSTTAQPTTTSTTAQPTTTSTTVQPTTTSTTVQPTTTSTTVQPTTTTAQPTTITAQTTTTLSTSTKPRTEQTAMSEPVVMTTLAEESTATTKQEIESTTELPTEKMQMDVTSAPTSSESLSKLVSEPSSNGVFNGLLMGSKLQESFNSLFPIGIQSRIGGDLTLVADRVSEVTVSTDALESSELREETTAKPDSRLMEEEVLEEIKPDVSFKVTTVETQRQKETTTETSKEEITESAKSLYTGDIAAELSLEETSSPTTTNRDSTTTELFLAATYIPPQEDSSEASSSASATTRLSDSKLIDEPQGTETIPSKKANSDEAKSRNRRWARKRRAPTAQFKFWTELDAATTKNDSYRSRRGVDDLSMQLQNGMFDSHVAHGQELFTQLPRRPFWVDGVAEEMVAVMEYTASFPYAYIPRLHAFALEFPLDDERYRLLLLLPAERGAASLGQLLRSLARGQAPLRGVMRSLRLTRLHAVVPAFMAEGFVILTPTLQQMGIWDLFDPRRADLSGMTSTPNLYVRNIEQAVTVVVKSYVEILDIQTRTTAARSRTESFVASHPFLYFVMDAETHVALMAGKVVDPLNSRIY